VFSFLNDVKTRPIIGHYGTKRTTGITTFASNQTVEEGFHFSDSFIPALSFAIAWKELSI
jgi:hypothetical protein